MDIIKHAKRLRDNYDIINNNKQLLIFGSRFIEAKKCYQSELEFWEDYVLYLDVSETDSQKTVEKKCNLIAKGYERVNELKEALAYLDMEVEDGHN